MTLRKAQRQKAKLKIGLFGPSGSGKTYSSLLLARGITDWGKIAIIDTENGSADLYSHLGGYNVIMLEPPFSPENYIKAIKECEDAGMEVIIIDSISQEWDGKGGCLEMHDQLSGKNSFTAWAKITPHHNKFVETIVQSKAHVICCGRTKQDYVLQEKNGKQVPQKVGLKAVTREGFDYEMTISFDLDIKHNATTSKDRTGLFMDRLDFQISQETGKELISWSNGGADNLNELKKEIADKCRDLDPLAKSKEDFEKIVKDQTGLELAEENYKSILAKFNDKSNLKKTAKKNKDNQTEADKNGPEPEYIKETANSSKKQKYADNKPWTKDPKYQRKPKSPKLTKED